jgi:putative transposase
LKEILRQTAQRSHAAVIELETMPDHTCTSSKCRCVHLLWEADPQFGIHRLVRYLKGRSSHQLRSHMSTLWANLYFVATVGGAPLAVIEQYIENQKSV